jgi:hypothetical protein
MLGELLPQNLRDVLDELVHASRWFVYLGSHHKSLHSIRRDDRQEAAGHHVLYPAGEVGFFMNWVLTS